MHRIKQDLLHAMETVWSAAVAPIIFFIPPPDDSKKHLVHFRTFPISKMCFNVVPYIRTETGSWYSLIPNEKESFRKSPEIYF